MNFPRTQSQRVEEIDRTVIYVDVKSGSIGVPQRVFADEPPDSLVIVACSVSIVFGFRVKFTRRKAEGIGKTASGTRDVAELIVGVRADKRAT